MRKAALFIGALCLFTSIAKAGDVHIMPWCEFQGPVYFRVSPLDIRGYIGTDYMRLPIDDVSISGEVKGQKIDLVVSKNGLVRGYLGSTKAVWRLSPRGDVIYGFQPCVSGPFSKLPH
jgi:hypothetical protein